jgi:hypothetical protein
VQTKNPPRMGAHARYGRTQPTPVLPTPHRDSVIMAAGRTPAGYLDVTLGEARTKLTAAPQAARAPLAPPPMPCTYVSPPAALDSASRVSTIATNVMDAGHYLAAMNTAARQQLHRPAAVGGPAMDGSGPVPMPAPLLAPANQQLSVQNQQQHQLQVQQAHPLGQDTQPAKLSGTAITCIVIGVILAVAIAACIGYYFYNKNAQEKAEALRLATFQRAKALQQQMTAAASAPQHPPFNAASSRAPLVVDAPAYGPTSGLASLEPPTNHRNVESGMLHGARLPPVASTGPSPGYARSGTAAGGHIVPGHVALERHAADNQQDAQGSSGPFDSGGSTGAFAPRASTAATLNQPDEGPAVGPPSLPRPVLQAGHRQPVVHTVVMRAGIGMPSFASTPSRCIVEVADSDEEEEDTDDNNNNRDASCKKPVVPSTTGKNNLAEEPQPAAENGELNAPPAATPVATPAPSGGPLAPTPAPTAPRETGLPDAAAGGSLGFGTRAASRDSPAHPPTELAPLPTPASGTPRRGPESRTPCHAGRRYESDEDVASEDDDTETAVGASQHTEIAPLPTPQRALHPGSVGLALTVRDTAASAGDGSTVPPQHGFVQPQPQGSPSAPTVIVSAQEQMAALSAALAKGGGSVPSDAAQAAPEPPVTTPPADDGLLPPAPVLIPAPVVAGRTTEETYRLMQQQIQSMPETTRNQLLTAQHNKLEADKRQMEAQLAAGMHGSWLSSQDLLAGAVDAPMFREPVLSTGFGAPNHAAPTPTPTYPYPTHQHVMTNRF